MVSRILRSSRIIFSSIIKVPNLILCFVHFKLIEEPHERGSLLVTCVPLELPLGHVFLALPHHIGEFLHHFSLFGVLEHHALLVSM